MFLSRQLIYVASLHAQLKGAYEKLKYTVIFNQFLAMLPACHIVLRFRAKLHLTLLISLALPSLFFVV